MKRERLLTAALEAFPTEPLHAYGEASERYRSLIEIGSTEELQSLLTARLALTMRRWRKLVDDHLKRQGQSLTRWQTLFELAINEPGETLTSIATRVGVMGPTLVGLLDELERDGLIERTVDKKDRRSKLIVLTSAGEQTVSSMFNLMVKLRKDFLKGIGQSEMLLMLDAIDVMSHNLEDICNQG